MTVWAGKPMNKTLFASISGLVAFATSYVVVVIGVYIKCFFNEVTFILPVALAGGLRGGVMMGVVIFLLQLLAGAKRS